MKPQRQYPRKRPKPDGQNENQRPEELWNGCGIESQRAAQYGSAQQNRALAEPPVGIAVDTTDGAAGDDPQGSAR